MAKGNCIICNKTCGFFSSYKIESSEKYICFDCIHKIYKHNEVNELLIRSCATKLKEAELIELYDNPELSVHDFYKTEETEAIVKKEFERKERWEQEQKTKKEKQKQQDCIKKISGVTFDDNTKEISFNAFREFFLDDSDAPNIYPYASLVKYEYKEGSNTLTQGGSGLGRAIVGGVLFGGAGAVVGATTRKKTQKNVISEMSVFITFELDGKRYVKKVKINEFYDNDIKYGSSLYMKYLNDVECLMGILDDIYFSFNQEETAGQNNIGYVSAADEILKFKQLLDMGIITEDEFNTMKKKLLEI